MRLPIAFIDTFTGVPFRGNPTAVCMSIDELKSETMHSIAKEINFPVTAFIRRNNIGDGYEIRYFTATTEIPACGHATLAAARMVVDRNPEIQVVKLSTISKTLIQAIIDGTTIMMTYPTYTMKIVGISDALLSSLQLKGFQIAGYCSELETLFIEVDDPSLLRTIEPDYKRLVQSDDTIKEVVVTSASDNKEYDYLLRSFCPWIGINEDPVTGSVHSVLGNFWKQRFNKTLLKAYQSSERGGELIIKAFDDHTQIGGESVIILRGELSV